MVYQVAPELRLGVYDICPLRRVECRLYPCVVVQRLLLLFLFPNTPFLFVFASRTVGFQFVLEFLHVLKNDVFVAVPIGLRT